MAMIESRARATSDPEARRGVLAQVEEAKVDYILLWFTDLEGHLKGFAITLDELSGALDDGMGFDGSSITGFNAIEESDMVAMPDPSTFRILPAGTGEPAVGRMICDVVTPDGKFLYAAERTSSTIGAFSVDTANGKLTYLASTPTEKQPRGFAVRPAGKAPL